MALRGTFLVGPRPADADLVRRFILCAAESGIDIFRLHDPLNDVDDLVGPIAAVREAGASVYAGLVYSDAPGGSGLVERAQRLSELGVDRVLLHDPAGALDPAAAGALIGRMGEASGVPVGLYAQGPGGTALAVAIEAARAGADPIATASYPVAMLTQRPAAELLTQALRGLGLDAGLDREIGWEVARRIETEIGDAASVAPPVSPQVALRAALSTVPGGPRRRRRAPARRGRRRRPPRRGARGGAPRARRLRLAAARRTRRTHPRDAGHPARARRPSLGRGRRGDAPAAARRVRPPARARSTRPRARSPRRRRPRTRPISRSTRRARSRARSRPPRRSSAWSRSSARARSRCSRACAAAIGACRATRAGPTRPRASGCSA